MYKLQPDVNERGPRTIKETKKKLSWVDSKVQDIYLDNRNPPTIYTF